MKRIAIFASGSGSNAENIFHHFKDSDLARVELILSNRSDAGVLHRAIKLGVQALVFDRHAFYETNDVVGLLDAYKIDYIVLAGFLWLVPENLVKAYEGRIVNIHPALLPKHGGKGMYGDRVHKAVIEAGDTETGITIHKVNGIYDSGDVIAQYKIPVEPNDTPETVAQKVHTLEYNHFPKIIELEIAKCKSM